MATDYETLIPSGIAEQAIAAAEQASVVLALGNVIRMRAGVESIPVVSPAEAGTAARTVVAPRLA